MTTIRLPLDSDCAACSAWSRQTTTVKNDALRELAEALVRCAELTEQTYPVPAAPVVEGVAG